MKETRKNHIKNKMHIGFEITVLIHSVQHIEIHVRVNELKYELLILPEFTD